MGQFVLTALVVAALISIVYGRSAGRRFMDGVFQLIGAVILFIVLTGVAIYFIDKKQAAEARRARPQPPATRTSSPPAQPLQPAATYQAQAHTCPNCQGTGTAICNICHGTSYKPATLARERHRTQGMPEPPDCPRCGIVGIDPSAGRSNPCPRCNGTGQVWY